MTGVAIAALVVAGAAVAASAGLAMLAVRATSSAADARAAAAELRAQLALARADATNADTARRRAEVRAAALEEELAHVDDDAPTPTDARGARARTLRLVRRWADAEGVPAAPTGASPMPDGGATEPANEPLRP